MSYHGLGNFAPAQTPQRKLARVQSLPELAMWKPGYPIVPKGAAYWRVAKTRAVPIGRMWMEFFDAQRRPMGTVIQHWSGNHPVAPSTKTPMVYTDSGSWGPVTTPESEVGPVDIAFPYERVPWVDETGSIWSDE